MSWYVGVDVGGTFTDFYAFDSAAGQSFVHKVPSTPEDPSAAILSGLDEIIEREGIEPTSIARISHGTTVATNTLIERRGAKLALVTTAGFRDLLEIGRQTRPRMYDLKADNPPPLVARQHRKEVRERIGPDGEVLTPLDPADIDACVRAVGEIGADACSVCFLFSFLHADHEQAIRDALKQAYPDLAISLSSEVQPEFREYERFTTTTINAYLQPRVSRYLRRLAAELEQRAPAAQLGINQSSGGLMSVERAERYPIRTALSGPAAGVVGAIDAATSATRGDVITLDMGGTSADVCLIRDGQAEIAHERDVAGFPVRMPAVDINTVGAGGGSIAHFGPDGLLKVGPASAGATPGPACYGRGGTQPTVSDANLVLGRLSEVLIGGSMRLDRTASETAIQPLADELGIDIQGAAAGILQVVAANMVRAIRAVSVERGHDPRQFALVAFGGAGALHGVEVARQLGMREVIVPRSPGILCAHGLIVADLKESFVTTHRIVVDRAPMDELKAPLDGLIGAARDWYEREGISTDARQTTLALDMRYLGQNYEIEVEIDVAAGDRPPRLPDLAELKRRFFAEHERAYGHHDPDAAVELVNLRVTAVGQLARPAGPARHAATGAAPPRSHRPVWFTGEAPVEAPVYAREDLSPGAVIPGPAIVDQLDATTVLWPDDTGRVDDGLNLIIEVAS